MVGVKQFKCLSLPSRGDELLCVSHPCAALAERTVAKRVCLGDINVAMVSSCEHLLQTAFPKESAV